MQSSHNILTEELKDIAPAVANLSKDNPYTVPVGYFDLLADKITERALLPIAGAPALNTYTVPENYFDALAAQMLQRVKNVDEINEELAETPLLAAAGKQNLLTVPEKYFEDLVIGVPAEIANEPAKVISIGGQVRKWAAYAAAASVLFFLFIPSAVYISHRMKNMDQQQLTIEQKLATLGDDEIVDYLKENTDMVNDAVPASYENIDDPKINHLLINTSDAELEKYLDADEGSEIEVKGI